MNSHGIKRILFVDDEPELLDSLRARLYKRRHEWNMVFLTSAQQAFAELEQGAADLVVSDVRMPGIDGGEFLRVLKEHWPETIRIVLSGYAEQVQVLKLVSLAHQYIAKPCDAQRLENVIDRCFRLSDILCQDSLRSVVGRISSLPSMPSVYTQLQEALLKPDTSAATLADIVAQDAAITAKVLQVANSAFFRLPRPLTRIKDAVAYLGFASIRNMALSAEIFTHWQPQALKELDVERMQAHALAIADASMALAAGTPLADDAWLAGLLHDIGYYVLMQEEPQRLMQAVALAREQGIACDRAERQIIGASHAEIGAYLLGLWGLPYPIVEAVAWHHTPQLVPKQGFDLLAIIATAHALLGEHAMPIAHLSNEMLPAVNEEYFSGLNPPFDWQEATRRVRDACSHLAS